MNARPDGFIGLYAKRRGLCLTVAGSVLCLISLVNLAIGRAALFDIKLVRPGLFGWPSVGRVPLPILILSGIFGFATGTAMLILAAYLRAQPTKSRLIGCALIGVGIVALAASLDTLHGLAWQGLLFIGTGAALLRRRPRPSAPPVSD